MIYVVKLNIYNIPTDPSPNKHANKPPAMINKKTATYMNMNPETLTFNMILLLQTRDDDYYMMYIIYVKKHRGLFIIAIPIVCCAGLRHSRVQKCVFCA